MGSWRIVQRNISRQGICLLYTSRGIVDDPPFTVREGGMIRKGYNAELDELHDIAENNNADVYKRQEISVDTVLWSKTRSHS